MLAGIRSRLTYANVVSTLCLFILLGGGAWAAATINSKDVVDNSLKSVDLKDQKGVQGADVVPDSLGGAAVDESSLGQVPSAAVAADAATAGVAGNSDLLDGQDASDFLGAGATAVDADLLDGKASVTEVEGAHVITNPAGPVVYGVSASCPNDGLVLRAKQHSAQPVSWSGANYSRSGYSAQVFNNLLGAQEAWISLTCLSVPEPE